MTKEQIQKKLKDLKTNKVHIPTLMDEVEEMYSKGYITNRERIDFLDDLEDIRGLYNGNITEDEYPDFDFTNIFKVVPTVTFYYERYQKWLKEG